jgi:phosphocarrier protein
MQERTVLIQNRTGLHARPATEFVAKAKEFSSKIRIRNAAEGQEVDAKSIMMVLSLALSRGDEAVITATGDDALAAADALVELISSYSE